MLALASFVCGLVFGWGLLISGMTQPEKVLGFLDIFGRWDPTMALVMAGALAISALGFLIAKRRRAPIFAAQSLWPTRTDIDRRLVTGAVLFGAGWGMVGLVQDRRWKIWLRCRRALSSLSLRWQPA